MSLIVTPKVGRDGQIADQPSNYQPSDDVRERIAQVTNDYRVATTIRNQPYEEFNNRDLITYLNESQRAFNSFVADASDDPDDAWKANTVRPLTRNKVISIAANVTAELLFPAVEAQNSEAQEDRDAAQVMRDIMEWSLEESDYEKKFTFAVIAACVNPATIIHEDFADVKRKVKEIQEDGSWEEKEVRDEVFSGFINKIVPVDEFYIGDIYEFEMQKQPFLIWRRVIDYNNAAIKYQNNENFKEYVRPGIRVFYIDERDTFYEQYDDTQHDRLVEEVVYYNRFADLQLTFVNGVLMEDDPDSPLLRADKQYPFVKSGYELIDEGRFFYYKSLVDKLKDDQRVIDTMYNMILDGTFLQVMPPAVASGDEDVDASVIMPGMVTNISEGSTLETINTNNNLAAGYNAMAMLERSATESSADPQASGLDTPGSRTATQVVTLEQNARVVLGLFGKMIKFMVEQFGDMRLATIVQYLPIIAGMEVIGDVDKIKFNSLLVKDSNERNSNKKRRIEFSLDIPEDEEAREEEENDMLQKEIDEGVSIARVNPNVFKKLKFSVKVQADALNGRTEAVKRALKVQLYDRLAQNQIVDQVVNTKENLIEPFFPGESDKFILDQTAGIPGQPGENPVQQELLNQVTGNEDSLGRLIGTPAGITQ